jgi:transcriptional regulator with XRE-family HTH domain
MSEKTTNNLIALGRTVRHMREESGMSATGLAAAAGIERERLDAIEAGRFDPTYDVLLALAEGLGVEPAALVRRVPRDLDPKAVGVAFGQQLRALRVERGISQERLANKTGIHRTTVFKLERGEREPLLSTMLRLARSLDVKPITLLDALETV